MYSREDFNEIGCGRGKKICMDWHYPQFSTRYSISKLFMQHKTYHTGRRRFRDTCSSVFGGIFRAHALILLIL